MDCCLENNLDVVFESWFGTSDTLVENVLVTGGDAMKDCKLPLKARGGNN